MRLSTLALSPALFFSVLTACGAQSETPSSGSDVAIDVVPDTPDDVATDSDTADTDVATDVATDVTVDTVADADLQPDAVDDTDTADDVEVDLDAAPDSDLDVSADTDIGSEECEVAASTLASELYTDLGACTVALRLDHDGLQLLGYQVFCGPYAAVSLDDARTTAQVDTGYGAETVLLSPEDAEDVFVFYLSPGDFGGASVVSARTGLTVFGGSIVWDGAGDIVWPATWRDASELGEGCSSSTDAFHTSRGYDLLTGGALDTSSVDAAVAVAADTAISAAFVRGGYLFDTVVLRYPRTVGAFDSTTAEWVVLVNGGWLE